MRKSGILFPITSLPSPYGIGTMGKVAYKFIDFLNMAKQSYWQVLPLGPTSFGDSPYQTFSAFAGNPYLIDLQMLVDDGYLEIEEIDKYYHLPLSIDYGYLYEWRFDVLHKAYIRFLKDEEYFKFVSQNDALWLNNYALFMALKKCHNDCSWQEWKQEYKYYNPEILQKFYLKNQDEVDFWKFIQYIFFKQWKKLKEYANQSNVEIIGDVPIYVALDSADVWANPNYFQLDENLKPTRVAGCPPDDFAKTGQLWGNPLYNYPLMEKEGFSWWINRMKSAFCLFDVVRIDHFRGFEAYYSIPAEDETAEYGKWVKGPGMKLFKKLKEELGELRIIAEDLGFLTEKVHALLKKTGFPGMKILEFAFDPKSDSAYLPHNHIKHCVVYTGTHDNMPIRAWFNTLNDVEKHFVREYLMITSDDKVCDQMVRCALESVADLVIIPIQDYLGLGIETRINTPSTKENNWTYRLDESYLSNELALYIAFLTKLYRRIKEQTM